jgi:pimeloyl-ACP methyl ester carboxylesterase
VKRDKDVHTLETVKTIILVHGAFSDASIWSGVIPLLELKGFRVVAVQLALTSLAEDIVITERALALEAGPVLLVAHWYGGVVITEVGNNPKVAGLVYVAALAPDRNESAISLLDTFPPTHLFRDLTTDGHGFLKVTSEGGLDLANDLSESQRNLLLATQRPTAEVVFSGKVKDPAWRKKPSWFLIPSDDRAVGTELQKREAEKANATVLTVTSSHLVLVSHPNKVQLLLSKQLPPLRVNRGIERNSGTTSL